MPPKIHPDPLPIVEGYEPHHQAFASVPTRHATSNTSVLVKLEVSQNSGSKKEEPSTNEHQSGLLAPVISILDTESDRQNTQPEDVLVITISDTSLGSIGDHRVEFEEAPNIVPVSSSDSFIIETHEVITLEDEPTDTGSEPEIRSCHVAAGIKEEVTTSSTSINEEDLNEGVSTFFS
ncbi:hypothetical protein AAC387_Pa01g2169 [Persea americana]